MIHVKFKNLESSDLIRDIASERISSVIRKFPQLANQRVIVTLEMENSPTQPGPDLFSVKVHFRERGHKSLTIKKASTDLHTALADVTDHLLENINRLEERDRTKNRNAARRTPRLTFPFQSKAS
ncbi:MAG: hypothetical protein RJB38_829 [Pseudomonadota bacterium]|jgi:ribosome-associated translation inhibitor RaiA